MLEADRSHSCRSPPGDGHRPLDRTLAAAAATYNDRPYRRVNTAEWADLFDQIAATPDDLDEALDLDLYGSCENWREEDTLPKAAPIPNQTIHECIKFIDKTGLVPFFNKALAGQKQKAGRSSRFTPQALLVALWWCVTERHPLLLSEVAVVLTQRISPTAAALLGVRQDTDRIPVSLRPKVSAAAATGTGQSTDFTDLKAAEKAVGSLFQRMLSHIDPSVLPKNRRMSHADLLAAQRVVPESDRVALQAALDWVCNQMLQASFMGLPRAIRRQWLHRPSGCIDATPMRVAATLENSDLSSRDPDAGPYKRYSQTTPDKVVKHMQAYDLHLFITGDDQPGREQHTPGLVLAMTADRPGVDPAGASRRLFSSLDYRNLSPKRLGKKGYLSGDRLYTGQDADWFQIPAAKVGFRLSLDYRDDQLGHQGAHASQMTLVEGQFYCPAMTTDLVNATTDFRAKKITHAQYLAKIAERNTYRMRVKQQADEKGTMRLRCPAAGHAPTAACVLKPASMKPRNITQPDGTKTDTRLEIIPAGAAFDLGTPHVCASDAVTVKIEDGAKYRQAEAYGTEQQRNVFKALRSTQEGGHGFAKDEAKEALGTPGLRRVRGKAAQFLFAAFILAAANMRKIASYTRQAFRIPETGRIFVIKKTQHRANRWNTDPSSDVTAVPSPRTHPTTASPP